MSRAKTKVSKSRSKSPAKPASLAKAATGIEGLDDVLGGGLPRGRPTLICGGPGCGKTLFGLHIIFNGVAQGEPGVVISFEESAEDLAQNVASLGVDLNRLVRSKKLAIDHVHIDRSEILETGGYDLSGLFARVEYAVDAVGAKRILLDTPEMLFAGFSNMALLRSELERLFRWLKDKGLTTVITGERGEATLTRHGLEEYVSDCVISLDHRVSAQETTRRLRIVKYRGSTHGTNEYPFLIGNHGISVLPITSVGLAYEVSNARVSSGIAALDEMLSGKGYFRGSSVLVTGTAGTGKSSVAAAFVAASCARNEKCLYFALEEPTQQVVRNMRSIGCDLGPLLDRGLLQISASRPTVSGLEQHLISMHAAIERLKPKVVIVDPISSLATGNNFNEVKSMLVRLFDYLKGKGITGLFTYLSAPRGLEETELGVSSLIDTWLELRDIECRGERNRALYILKSRGMAHSNQVREFVISRKGLNLVDVILGPEGALIGSARLGQAAALKAERARQTERADRRSRELGRRRQLVEAQIAALRAELALEEEDAEREPVASARSEAGAAAQRSSTRQSKRGARPTAERRE